MLVDARPGIGDDDESVDEIEGDPAVFGEADPVQGVVDQIDEDRRILDPQIVDREPAERRGRVDRDALVPNALPEKVELKSAICSPVIFSRDRYRRSGVGARKRRRSDIALCAS